IVTKAGGNSTHGDALFLGRPGELQSTTFSADQQCPASVASCVVPRANGSDVAIVPPDIPDALAQGSFAVGGPMVRDRTHYFVAGDITHQDRTASIATPLVPAGTTYVGNYRQALANGRVDHKVNASHSLMARVNLDRF